MASRLIAVASLHVLAVCVAGRRSQEEYEFPTNALRAVGTIVAAGGPQADPNAAQRKAVHLNHHVPGEMHEEGPSNPWKLESASMELAFERYQANHQASEPVLEEESPSFKGHAFASQIKAIAPEGSANVKSVAEPEMKHFGLYPEDYAPRGQPGYKPSNSLKVSEPGEEESPLFKGHAFASQVKAIAPVGSADVKGVAEPAMKHFGVYSEDYAARGQPGYKQSNSLTGSGPSVRRPATAPSTAQKPMAAPKPMVVPGPIKLTYFGIEGVAEKVRLAFVLGGIDFEDDRVAFDQWQAMKPTTKFGSLPLLKVGNNAPVAQSGAMLRWAGQLSGLNPPEQVLQIEEAIGLAEDMQRALMPSMYIGMKPKIYGYPEDMPAEDKKEIQMRLREKLMEPDGDLPRFLGYLQDLLGKDKYICGDKVTIADCQIIPQLRSLTSGAMDGIPSTILDDFPKLKAYVDRFHSIDKVKAYHEKLAAAAAAEQPRDEPSATPAGGDAPSLEDEEEEDIE